MSGYTRPLPLTRDDDSRKFDCGEPSLDDWLCKRVLINQGTGASRCFVTHRDERVVGYYALATGSVQRLEAPTRVGHGMPEPILVVLLAGSQSTEPSRVVRWGAICYAMRSRASSAPPRSSGSARCSCTLSTSARGFYLHFNFEPSPTGPMHLMLLMKDARRLIRGTAE